MGASKFHPRFYDLVRYIIITELKGGGGREHLGVCHVRGVDT